MPEYYSRFRSNRTYWLAFTVGLAVVLISSTTTLAQTPLLNGSFEVDVVPNGFTAQVPTDWRQTWGFDYTINIYRPGEGDAFYGQIPDGDQALYYTDNSSQEMQPGLSESVGTGIVMEEGVAIQLLFDAVFYGPNENGSIQFNALVDGVAYNTQYFVPNSATDGFGTFTYEYTPTASDAGKNFSFWCYSTSGTSEFLVDNFRTNSTITPPPTKPAKPGPVAGGPVIAGGSTPYAWYRADVGVTPYDGDANTLAWWQDQSGNSRHVESFSNPQITTNGNDGSQVITFDGIGDTLIGDAAEWGEAAPGTVFAVWKRSSADTGSSFVYDAHLDEQRQFLAINTASGELQAGGGEYIADPVTWINHLTTNTADPGADEWFVTSVSSTTGVTDTFRINNAEVFNGDLLSGGMSGLRIGSFVLDTHFWEGDIAELIVFEGDLSATERKAIEDDLMDRWGVASWVFIPGDADKNGVVDDNDAATLAANWMASDVGWAGGDFNDDGIVDDIDATILATNWQVSAAGTSVPEPGTLVLLAGLAALLLWNRKRQ